MIRAAKLWLMTVLALAIAGLAVQEALAQAPGLKSPSAAVASASAAVAEKPAPRSALLGSQLVYVYACLNDRVLALLDLGERDMEALIDYGVRKCGANLSNFLARELERPEGMVTNYVRAAVRREILTLARR